MMKKMEQVDHTVLGTVRSSILDVLLLVLTILHCKIKNTERH